MSNALRVDWFERDPGGSTMNVAPAQASQSLPARVEERGLEYCTVCDDLTDIAVRSGDQRICYHCADDAE
jgi:hypothetical protein